MLSITTIRVVNLQSGSGNLERQLTSTPQRWVPLEKMASSEDESHSILLLKIHPQLSREFPKGNAVARL